MRELHVGYKELRGARIRVSPDGRRALLLGNQGSIFLLELSTRTAGEPHQLASAIVDGCFYDNDTCYFVGGRGGWEMGEERTVTLWSTTFRRIRCERTIGTRICSERFDWR